MLGHFSQSHVDKKCLSTLSDGKYTGIALNTLEQWFLNWIRICKEFKVLVKKIGFAYNHMFSRCFVVEKSFNQAIS
jgi:hypothetical protein